MKKLHFLSYLLLVFVFASCSDDDTTEVAKDEETPTVENLLSYTDVTLKLTSSDSEDHGVAFMSLDGTTAKEDEITTDNIGKIDFVSATNQAFISLDSPHEADETKDVEGVLTTKIQHSGVEMTAEEFEALATNDDLKDLSVTHDRETVAISYKGVLLFEKADGKKGAILVKSIGSDRVRFDVKVQK